MADATKIEWCDATFNPWWGCQKVSPACDHCYAERDAKRFAPGRVLWGVDSERRAFGDAHWDAPLKWAKSLPGKLGRRPRVFCASMADVFDKDAPVGQRARLFDLIDRTPQLDWLLLTKRIGNVTRMLHEIGPRTMQRGAGAFEVRTGLPPNVWLGITVANQEEADRDVPKLLDVPARVRFLSVEPMLGPISLDHRLIAQIEGGSQHGMRFIDWVICGGESGPNARPMHPDWARGLRNQCQAAGVPFLFKQWGEWIGADQDECPNGPPASRWMWGDGAPFNYGEAEGTLPLLCRAGKKAAGRLLDGVEHNGFPRMEASAV